MKSAIRSSALARIFLVAGFGVALSAMPANAQKPGGSIAVGLEIDIPGFDVLKVGVYDAAALTASSALFDTLTTLDANGKPQPKLALSWEPSEDFKMWTFKLRPGVKFHDGTPFNAAAYKANFDRQKDPASTCWSTMGLNGSRAWSKRARSRDCRSARWRTAIVSPWWK